MRHKGQSLIVPFVLLAALGSCFGTFVLGESGHADLYGLLLLLGLSFFVSLAVLSLVELTRAEKRKDLGMCAHCGYDLRASRSRCPECGTPADRAGPRDGGAA